MDSPLRDMKKNQQKLYKVLVDGKSCHGGDMKWYLPKKKDGKWIPGKWHEVKCDIEVCKTGLHLTTERFNWYKWGCTAYEVEADMTKESWEGNKVAVSKARLLKEVRHPKWWTDIEGWCKTLKEISWLKPDGKPKKEWKLFPTRAAALAAAGAAARDAAGAAARDAAGAAAWAADRAAARDAAGAAARDAARDAQVYGYATVAEWNFKSKHKIHIKKRMEVWQKGYGLLCDVNGVLYCYEKI